jgi:hypothetical protein
VFDQFGLRYDEAQTIHLIQRGPYLPRGGAGDAHLCGATEEARADNLACLLFTRAGSLGAVEAWFSGGVGEACRTPVGHLGTAHPLTAKASYCNLLAIHSRRIPAHINQT